MQRVTKILVKSAGVWVNIHGDNAVGKTWFPSSKHSQVVYRIESRSSNTGIYTATKYVMAYDHTETTWEHQGTVTSTSRNGYTDGESGDYKYVYIGLE